MGSIRVPLYRSETNGTMNPDEDNSVFELQYDMATVDNFHPGANDGTIASRYPIAIYSYEVQIVADFFGVLWQSYGDTDDASNLRDYNVSNDEFCLGLKQVKLFHGTSTTMSKTTLSYRAKKNPKHLRAKFGKWKRPPIYLGPSAGNFLTIMVHNSSDSTNRTWSGLVTIHSWKQFL